MDTLSLFGKNNESLIVNVVRYFEMNNNFYLIFYPTNETVDAGYIKLYVAKIINENEKFYTYPIDDDEEWNGFKTQIQRIVLNNRNGIQNESDADYSKLVGITISDFKLFKLREQTTGELGQNKKVFPKEVKVESPVEPVVAPVIPTIVDETPAPVVEEEQAPVYQGTAVSVEQPVEPIVEPTISVEQPVVSPVEPVKNEEIENMQKEIDELKLENTELKLFKEKYEKLVSDFDNMKHENFKLIDDNTRLAKKISEVKKIMA